jgi:hypothetical protein
MILDRAEWTEKTCVVVLNQFFEMAITTGLICYKTPYQGTVSWCLVVVTFGIPSTIMLVMSTRLEMECQMEA